MKSPNLSSPADGSPSPEDLRRQIEQLSRLLAEQGRQADAVERRYRGLVDRLDAIFWEASVETFDFTYVSPRAEPLLGYPLGRWTEPRFWGSIIHPDDRDWVMACCQEAMAAGRDNDFTYRVIAADGRVVWMRDLVYVDLDEAGRPKLLRGVMLDVTAQKAVEEALRDSGAAKDRFLAMLAHELRNPLGALSNALHVMRSAQPGTPPWNRAMDIVERQVRHQSQLLNDLLEVSRLTRGKTELRWQTLDLALLVEETAEDSRGAIEQAGLSLELELPGKPVWVEGDPTQLAQVLTNLLTNAAKFTRTGGRVTVRAAEDAVTRRASVTVTDTGIGIAPDMLPQVWEAFSQADQSLDRTQGGLGLGLALVRGLIGLHGGEVRAESEGSGRGSSFTFVLPTVEPPAEAEPAAEPEPGQGSLRVLVIEDNRDAAETLGDLLSLFGHEVELAHTGPEGVEAARRLRPDVVLCDIGLPGMDGYAVARQLRQDPETAGLRLVALTGYGRDSDRRQAEEAGFDLHLVKPVGPAELKKLLERWAVERS